MRTPALALVSLLAACGGPSGDDDDVPCEAALLAGDLVITEVFANAAGEDEGKEWFEIYNATTGPVNLQGAVLLASKSDGADEDGHIMAEQIVEPGDYLVVGGVIHDLRPGYVDYGYGADLRVPTGLPNTEGRLAVQCGDVLVDEMTWIEASDATSLALAGQTAPDYTFNDDTANWCDSITEFETDSFGTPGSANDGCGSVNPTECDDGDGVRPVVPPAAGDVVISEYMARPDAAIGAANGEWLEVYVANDLDLNGLQIGRAEPVGGPQEVRTTLSSASCLAFTAGSYVVIARNDDMTANGGIPAVDYLLGFGITDSDDGLFIGWGGEVLDAVTWVSQRPAATAVSLDPSKLDATENDMDSYWCDAVDAFGTGQLGTPGAENPSCDIPPPDGMCDMGGGELRAIIQPTAGQLQINEYMARPSAAVGTAGEWIELIASASFDLNGVELGQAEPLPTPTPKSIAQTIISTPCLPVVAGDRYVLARNIMSDMNGMLPVVDRQLLFGLTDDDDGVFVGVGGAVLDIVTWTSQQPLARSQQRDPDAPTTFCVTPMDVMFLYGADNYGTPGDPNDCTP